MARIGTAIRHLRYIILGSAETSKMKGFRIRALIFREKDWLCAQCLEYDIAVQGRSEKELRDNLIAVLKTHLVAAAELKQPPFAGIRSAPKKFFREFDESTEREHRDLELVRTSDIQSLVPNFVRFSELPFVVSRCVEEHRI
jgi:hypothetical protein